MIRIADEQAWRTARRRAQMLGYPRVICRFLGGLLLMLAATHLTHEALHPGVILPFPVSDRGLTGHAHSLESGTAAALRQTLNTAIAECLAQHRIDDSEPANGAAGASTDQSPTPTAETNRTIDSHGRRWAFDQDTHRWKSLP